VGPTLTPHPATTCRCFATGGDGRTTAPAGGGVRTAGAGWPEQTGGFVCALSLWVLFQSCSSACTHARLICGYLPVSWGGSGTAWADGRACACVGLPAHSSCRPVGCLGWMGGRVVGAKHANTTPYHPRSSCSKPRWGRRAWSYGKPPWRPSSSRGALHQ